MIKKFIFLIFLSTIFFTGNFAQDLDNNCCCCENNNNIPKEIVKNKDLLIKLDNSLAEYYKNNQWVFLEDVFIDLKNSFWYKIKFITAKSLSVTGVSLGAGLATFFICSLLDSDSDSKLILSVMTTAITAGVLTTWFKTFFDYYLDKKILKDFLKNYYLDSEVKHQFNYRDMVPPELINVFDSLKKESEGNWDYFFRKFGSKIVKQLREDIIYKKNPNKYFTPTIKID